MDTTRISIARVLALDVPLTWQDAVAVAQEAAMLSDVHAAMNSRPSLVSPETCFITRTGDLELPVTTEVESPDAVTLLLREMLAGRDAPEALESLAFGHATRDMSGALQQFPLANRRAEIAKLATRALALQSRPDDAPPAIPAVIPSALPAVTPSAMPAVIPAPISAAVPPVPPAPPSGPRPVSTAAPPTTPASVSTRPFVRQAPFRAADVVHPTAAAPAASVGVSNAAHDAELRRLRSKSVAREKARRRLSTRIRLAYGRFAQWVTWRPSSPDPRILGGAVVLTAALVSVVWTDDRPAASVPSASTSALPPATAPATRTPVPEASTPASVTTSAPPAAVSTNAAPLAAAVPRLAAGGRSSAALPDARPTAPAAAALPTTAGPGAERRLPTSAGRGGITVTLPALDPAPGPLTTDTGADARPGTPRASAGDGGGAGTAAVYSASNDDVAPPVMRRQQLPSSFPQPTSDVPEDWPYLELLIDRWGTVEQVRLHAKQPAPGQTLYRHRMLLAAAKAWQFEPARRNGSPVRYVMRVPLEP